MNSHLLQKLRNKAVLNPPASTDEIEKFCIWARIRPDHPFLVAWLEFNGFDEKDTMISLWPLSEIMEVNIAFDSNSIAIADVLIYSHNYYVMLGDSSAPVIEKDSQKAVAISLEDFLEKVARGDFDNSQYGIIDVA